MTPRRSSAGLKLGSRSSLHLRGSTVIPPRAPSSVAAKTFPTSARQPSKAEGADVAQPVSRIERLIASGSFFKEIKVEGLSQSRDMRQAADVQLYAPDSSASVDRPLGKHVRQAVTTRRRWYQKQTEGALVLPKRTIPGQRRPRFADGLHRPIGLIFASGHVLFTACQLSGVGMGPTWGPAAVGAVIGAAYAALNRFGMRRIWRAPHAPLNVVVTGGTRGLGKAMAREFLRCGDKVYISSRSMAGVRKAMTQLREEVGGLAWIAGIECDVSSPASVQRLMSAAASQMGSVDIWINNAGNSGTFQSFMEASPEQLAEVVQTNLLGTMLCTRAAMQALAGQPRGGHIFNMDGAGANNLPSPMYAAYGATKAGIAHLMGSLNKEAAAAAEPVRVHCLSPGMVLTDLLLAGATDRNKQIFNILCEQPETVAAFLVPRARTVAARGQVGRYIKFLTLRRAMLRFLTAPLHSNRFFDGQGNALYPEERERILGQKAKRTRRLAERAARRSKELAMAYSLSLAGAFLIMATDSAPGLHL